MFLETKKINGYQSKKLNILWSPAFKKITCLQQGLDVCFESIVPLLSPLSVQKIRPEFFKITVY